MFQVFIYHPYESINFYAAGLLKIALIATPLNKESDNDTVDLEIKGGTILRAGCLMSIGVSAHCSPIPKIKVLIFNSQGCFFMLEPLNDNIGRK